MLAARLWSGLFLDGRSKVDGTWALFMYHSVPHSSVAPECCSVAAVCLYLRKREALYCISSVAIVAQRVSYENVRPG